MDQPFPSLPYLPAAEVWRLSRRVDDPRVWWVYEALHAYEEFSQSYLESIRDYAGALAAGDSSVSHLTELRIRITEAFGDAESAFERASTALRQFATELRDADSGGGGVLTEPQRRADSPRRSAGASSMPTERETESGLSNTRSSARRSRSRSRSLTRR